MYNEQQKQLFIDEHPSTRNRYQIAFSIVEPYEQKCNQDIAEMDFATAKDCIESSGVDVLATVQSILYTLSEYVVWCYQNKIYDAVDGITAITIDDIDMSRILSKVLFRSSDDLFFELSRVKQRGEGRLEFPYLAFAWLGLSKAEALLIEDSQVDMSNRIVYAADGSILSYGFSDIVYDVLYDFQTCNVSVRDTSKSPRKVIKDLSSTRFMKRFAPPSSKLLGLPLTEAQLDSAMRRVNESYRALGFPPRFAFTNVQRSGRLYRLWQLEMSGVDVFNRKNRDKVLSIFRLEMDNSYYYTIIRTYKQYKQAFGIE